MSQKTGRRDISLMKNSKKMLVPKKLDEDDVFYPEGKACVTPKARGLALSDSSNSMKKQVTPGFKQNTTTTFKKPAPLGMKIVSKSEADGNDMKGRIRPLSVSNGKLNNVQPPATAKHFNDYFCDEFYPEPEFLRDIKDFGDVFPIEVPDEPVQEDFMAHFEETNMDSGLFGMDSEEDDENYPEIEKLPNISQGEPEFIRWKDLSYEKDYPSISDPPDFHSPCSPAPNFVYAMADCLFPFHSFQDVSTSDAEN